MSAPTRIRLSRAKGWRMPAGAMKVDRSTRYGNPFNLTQAYAPFDHRGYPIPLVKLRTAPGLDRALDLFVAYLRGVLSREPDFLDRLKGKHLACWCPLDQPCHADVLLDLANRLPDPQP
jgi:hypothetical protein